MGQRNSKLHPAPTTDLPPSNPNPSLKVRDSDDDCRVLRRTLGAVHKICKEKPRQIGALAQSLGQAAGPDGPDRGLAMYIKNFDDSVVALYRHFQHNVHLSHAGDLRLSRKATSDDLGRLAVDIERWYKDFTAHALIQSAHGKESRAASSLKAEAKTLGKRCYAAAGRLDALTLLHENRMPPVKRSARGYSPSMTTIRTISRTPSPVVRRSGTPVSMQYPIPTQGHGYHPELDPRRAQGLGFSITPQGQVIEGWG
ncbi:hypothetical protein LTR67_009909 [Exophiala xenobiotica]